MFYLANLKNKSEPNHAGNASENTDSSEFYTEIETKILKTDSDPNNMTAIDTQLLE